MNDEIFRSPDIAKPGGGGGGGGGGEGGVYLKVRILSSTNVAVKHDRPGAEWTLLSCTCCSFCFRPPPPVFVYSQA